MTALNGEIMSPMTYSGASWRRTVRRRLSSSRGTRARAKVSTRRQCCATEKICAPLVCPFQRATRARPWAMSSISMSSGEGSSRSSRRPDSMRCQARSPDEVGGVAGRAVFVTAVLLDMPFLSELGAGFVTVAADEMVVDHADGLHESINNGRPAEFKTTLRQILGHRLRYLGLGRHLTLGAKVVH